MNTLPSPCIPPSPHYENRPYLCSSRPHCNQSRRGGFQTRPRPKPLPLSSRMRGPIPSVIPAQSHPSEHAAMNLPPPLVSHYYENRPYLCSSRPHCNQSRRGGFQTRPRPKPLPLSSRMRGPIPSVFPPNPSSPHEHPTLIVSHHYENRPYLCSSRPHCNQSRRGGFQTLPRPKPLPLSSRMRGPIPVPFPHKAHPREHAAKNPSPPVVLTYAGTHPLRHCPSDPNNSPCHSERGAKESRCRVPPP